MLPLLWLNQAGLPVRSFGPVYALTIIIAAAVRIYRVRIVFPLRQITPFLGVLALAFLAAGYPMLRYGFDWAGYCNEDMANYVLHASNLVNHGYYSLPDSAQLLSGREISLHYWFFYTLGGARCGSELMLALVMSCTRMSGLQIFMPVIMAMHLALIAATGALIYRRRAYRQSAIVVCLWLAVSAQNTLGAMYQLIAQVYGLSLLIAFCVLTLRPYGEQSRRSKTRLVVLTALVSAAIAIVYPEVAPFAVLSFLVYHGILLLQRRESLRHLASFTLFLAGASAVLLNLFLPSALAFLTTQATSGLRSTEVSRILFPYFLLPSGLAHLWGFIPIGSDVTPAWVNAPILDGAILLLLCSAGAARQAWRGQPAAVVCSVMLALGIRLFAGRMDFGLFKLAMFIQPFLIGSTVLALGVADPQVRGRGRILKFILIAAIALLGIPGQFAYVQRSTGEPRVGVGLIEIPNASGHRLLTDLKSLPAAAHGTPFVSDAFNAVLAKFEAVSINPSPVRFPSDDYFSRAASPSDWSAPVMSLDSVLNPAIGAQAPELSAKARHAYTSATFDMKDPARPVNHLRLAPLPSGTFTLAASGFSQGIYNRRHLNPASQHEVAATESARVRNHLIFVASYLGQTYYAPGSERSAGRVAAYQLEKDFFYPAGGMAAIGRDLLFNIVNPTPRLRLVVEYTATLNADSRNEVPPAAVVGEQRWPFSFAGRGSARLISPPIEPQWIEGRPFVAIDMGATGKPFPDRRRGLMRAYGRDVAVDPRSVIGFARDISALSEQEFASMHPPLAVHEFPAGLANKDLEYSGVYEDGWVAERSFWRLQQPASAKFVLRCMVPQIRGAAASSSVRVLRDGEEIAAKQLNIGDNEIVVGSLAGAGPKRIDLIFDRAGPLSDADLRPASALIHSVGFEELPPTDIAASPVQLRENWYPFEHFGGQYFRWVNTDACVAIAATRPARGTLSVDVEAGPGVGSKAFRMRVSGAALRTLESPGARSQLSIPLTLKTGENKVCMSPEGGGTRIASDPRILNFRVFKIEWKAETAK